MRGQPGFFDIDDRLKRLSDLGDQLEIRREALRHDTAHGPLRRQDTQRRKGG